VKICESCTYRRIVAPEDVPLGVNRDNKRIDPEGRVFYLFCSYFYSFPSATARLTCSHYSPEQQAEPVAKSRPR